MDYGSLNKMVAEKMGVSLRDVEMMETRLSGGDFSLNSPSLLFFFDCVSDWFMVIYKELEHGNIISS